MCLPLAGVSTSIWWDFIPMEVVVVDKVEAFKTKYGPSRAMLKSIWLSVLHV
jgi:hypothetical protein